MSVAEAERIAAELAGQFPAAVPNGNGAHPDEAPGSLLTAWDDFDRLARGGMEYRIEGLLPREGISFTASAPKKGKTWLGLAKAVAVATGADYLERFSVVERCPVVYVALEGSPGGVRARIGALARGMGVDPDSADLRDWLHLSYKPRGMNLSDRAWAERLIADVERVDARLVVVDVLRRAATVRESAEGVRDFADLISNLEPLTADGRLLDFLHHFRKEGSNDENVATGERMSGSGSLWGHYDAATFITSASDLSMAVEVDGRDFRPPKPFRVEIQGESTGPWGYVYEDAARVVAVDAPARKVTKASAEEIRSFLAVAGGSAGPAVLRQHFKIAESTLRDRRSDLERIGVRYVENGRRSYYEIAPPAKGES